MGAEHVRGVPLPPRNSTIAGNIDRFLALSFAKVSQKKLCMGRYNHLTRHLKKRSRRGSVPKERPIQSHGGRSKTTTRRSPNGSVPATRKRRRSQHSARLFSTARETRNATCPRIWTIGVSASTLKKETPSYFTLDELHRLYGAATKERCCTSSLQ